MRTCLFVTGTTGRESLAYSHCYCSWCEMTAVLLLDEVWPHICLCKNNDGNDGNNNKIIIITQIIAVLCVLRFLLFHINKHCI